MQKIIAHYNKFFLWIVLAIPFLIQFFPKANKFDLVERFSPVLVVAFIIGAGCAIGWAKSAWMKKKEGKAVFKGPDIWAVVFLALFLLWSNMSFVYAEVRTFGFTEIYMLWTGALAFLYFSTCFTSKDCPTSLLRAYLPIGLTILLVLNAVIGVYGFLTTDHLRFFGFFFNPEIKADAWPNAFALFFLLTFPFALHTLFSNKKDTTKKAVLKLILTGFLIGVFFVSFSRAGYLAWVIEMILLAVFLFPSRSQFKKISWKKAAIGFLILALSAYGTQFGLQELKARSWETTDIQNRLTFSEAAGGNSFSERLEFFEGSIELANEKSYLGYGPASFKWVYPKVQKGFLSLSDHPHNLLLKYAVERGAPAAAFFFLFIITMFTKANPFSRKTSTFKKVAWAALLGAMAHSMVDHNFNFITNYLILWLIFASIVLESKVKKLNQNDYFTAIIAILLLISLLLSSVLIVGQTFEYKKLYSHETITEEDLANLNPILPRWWFLRLEDHFQDSNSDNLLLEKHLQFNPYDQMALGRIAKYAADQGDTQKALEAYKSALDANPKNTFKYWLAYTKTAKDLGLQDELRELKPKLMPLLDEYAELYANNVHFTQSTDEIIYANELTVLLEKY